MHYPKVYAHRGAWEPVPTPTGAQILAQQGNLSVTAAAWSGSLRFQVKETTAPGYAGGGWLLA